VSSGASTASSRWTPIRAITTGLTPFTASFLNPSERLRLPRYSPRACLERRGLPSGEALDA
jgi:hypothetical protein